MYIWFLFCIVGLIAMIPVHFLSVEHLKLQKRYGKNKGIKIGDILGLISGWGFFIFWMGVWISPQPRFSIIFFGNIRIFVPFINLSIPLFHFVIFMLFVVLGGWIAIKAVTETSLKVSETHRTDKIIKTGIYAKVRHPQYLGGLLAHFGFTFFFSTGYSLMSFPLIVGFIYLISWKEEMELIKEFGEEYEKYRKRVPMFFPKLRISH